jgi:hypothetical protein
MEYVTIRGTVYSLENGIFKRKEREMSGVREEKIERFVYLGNKVALRLYVENMRNKTTPGEVIFDQGHYQEGGGRIIWTKKENGKREFRWSSIVDERTPKFKKNGSKLEKEVGS